MRDRRCETDSRCETDRRCETGYVRGDVRGDVGQETLDMKRKTDVSQET